MCGLIWMISILSFWKVTVFWYNTKWINTYISDSVSIYRLRIMWFIISNDVSMMFFFSVFVIFVSNAHMNLLGIICNISGIVFRTQMFHRVAWRQQIYYSIRLSSTHLWNIIFRTKLRIFSYDIICKIDKTSKSKS